MKLLAELKRRNVYRAAAFYAAAGWLLVQIATQVFPFYEIPNWAVRLVIAAVLTGFPFALLVSWFYQWTPRGFRREREMESDSVPTTAVPISDHRSEKESALVSPADASIAILPFADLSS